MDNLLLLAFLGLLVAVCGAAEISVLERIARLRELEGSDADEGEDADFISSAGKTVVNVDAFDAVGDGVADDTEAFQRAWIAACSAQNAVFVVPEDRTYLVSAIKFKGPCADDLVIQIYGTMVAPDDPSLWDPKNRRIWLSFSNLTGVSFHGKGVIDGSGEKWWAASCKRNKSNPCVGAPTALTIASSTAVVVRGLNIKDSQQMHFVISQCSSVRVSAVQISAPGNSPNTDGIHITGSTDVVVQDAIIRTGDDCISIVNASSDIKMKRIYCGPGHGISIGSLGKDNSTGIVTKVVLETAIIANTTNGVRIKTWQGGTGYVEGVRFSRIRMVDVENPIIIDQNYCDSPNPCPKQTSAVQIRKVVYEDICGTTKTQAAMKFDCSDTFPCTGIVVSNVQIENEDGPVETYCHSANGLSFGYVYPTAECLEQAQRPVLTSSEEHLPVHTEL